MERPVVLCGLGRVGWHILQFLRTAGVPVAVVVPASDVRSARPAGTVATVSASVGGLRSDLSEIISTLRGLTPARRHTPVRPGQTAPSECAALAGVGRVP